MTTKFANVTRRLTSEELDEFFAELKNRVTLTGAKKKCVLCDGELDCPYGHNPFPLSETGRCCDQCNLVVVKERQLEREFDEIRWRFD